MIIVSYLYDVGGQSELCGPLFLMLHRTHWWVCPHKPTNGLLYIFWYAMKLIWKKQTTHGILREGGHVVGCYYGTTRD